MTDPRKDLPPVNSPNYLEKVREAVSTYLGNRGSALDRGVTLRDLMDAGMIKLRAGFGTGSTGSPIAGPGSAVGGADAYEPDLTPPPTPTGFLPTAGISYLLLECAPPVYTQGHGHARSKLYGQTWVTGQPQPVFSTAQVITEFNGTVASHATNPATTWHLWLTWVTVDGVESVVPAGGTNGVMVRTGEDVALLLEALTGEITESQLYAALGTRIDLIDTPTTGLVAQMAGANASITSINATLADIASTPTYDAVVTYAIDAIVKYNGGLYQAKSSTTGNLPTNTTYWTKIGDYASLGDAVAGHAVMLDDHNTRITTNAGGITSVAGRATVLETAVNNATTGLTSKASIGYVDTAKSDAISSAASTTQLVQAQLNVGGSTQVAIANAGSAASAAQTTASNALANAATAQTAANTANTAITDIASDAKLVPVEKSALRAEWDVIAAEKAGNNTQATTFAITTQNTTYNSAFQALATYLNNGTAWSTGIPSWISDASLGTTTTIVGATFRTNWKAYYDARTALLNAIALKAKALADSAQTQANTATTNAATAQTTANTAVTNAAAVATRATTLETAVNHTTTGLGTKASVTQVATAKSEAIAASATVTDTISARLNSGDFAAVQVQSSASASSVTGLLAQYTVKLDTAGLVSGYGLASTAGNAAPSSAFGVRANQFFIAPPATSSATAPTTNLYDGYCWLDTSVTPNVARYRSGTTWVLTSPVLPFVVQATATTLNGVSVPAGVYANDLYVKNGTITNLKVANGAIDNLKVVSVSAAKLTAGSIAVGQTISSTGQYSAGVPNWSIDGAGLATFNNAIVRGAVYASSGTFAGDISAATGTFAGNVRGGYFSAGNMNGWAWPTDGTVGGVVVHPNGILIGNVHANKYFYVESTGNLSMPGLSVTNGAATFSGTLSINNGASSRIVISNDKIEVWEAGVRRVVLGNLA